MSLSVLSEVPTTSSGKVTAGVTMMGGILIISMPVSVLSNNFHAAWQEYQDEKAFQQKIEEKAREQVTAYSVTVTVCVCMWFLAA